LGLPGVHMDFQAGSEERKGKDKPQDLASLRGLREGQDDREESFVGGGISGTGERTPEGNRHSLAGNLEGPHRKRLKLGIWRVWFHVIVERFDREKGAIVEISHTSPVMKVIAVEDQAHLLESLPEPEPGPPDTRARNVIVQVDQRYRDVTYQPRG